jgi:hypothetical protein
MDAKLAGVDAKSAGVNAKLDEILKRLPSAS